MAKTRLADGTPNPYDKRVREGARKGARKGDAGPNGLMLGSLLTEEKITEAAGYIGDGASLGMLSGLLGVTSQTFNEWVRRGEAERARLEKLEREGTPETLELKALRERERLYAALTSTVKQERAKRQLADWQIIGRAASGSPKVVRKEKRQLMHVAASNDEGSPIIVRNHTGRAVELDDLISQQMVITEVTETKTVEYDWKAAAYRLEKHDPAQFGPRATIDINRALPTDPAKLAEMELPELLALAEAIQSQLDGLPNDD